MYLTAHRVRELQGPATGLNVFFHSHDEHDPFAGSHADLELIRRITEAEPGRLVGKWTELKAGGNTVLSYLDVIAPEGTPRSDLEDALARFRSRVGSEGISVYGRYGNVLVSFGAIFGLHGMELQEYDRLRDALQSHMSEMSP